ncbi:MAG: type II CRISPR RNA-guided endonuclease Cas9, partial [Muribaculaceae bacterium]
MKKILGLDLGTNSIGWAVVNANDELNKVNGIEAAGSRIIPMTADELNAFNSGKSSESKCSTRTDYRSTRRLLERAKLRRSRLLRVLNELGFLPEHFAAQIDRYGNFIAGKEPKLAWRKDAQGKMQFLFKKSFEQMVHEFHCAHPDLVANNKLIPYDWTIYYLRKKALTQKITKEELAWILLNFNQKRGYFQLRGEDEEKEGERKEFMEQKVISVKPEENKKGKGKQWYIAELENGLTYKSTNAGLQMWQGKTKAFIVTYKLNEDGSIKKDKEGNDCYSMSMPQSEDDWTLLKEKTKKDIDSSGKTVGQYIYDAILANPDVKIRGGLVRTIERRFYKDELHQILTTQCALHSELHDRDLYAKCIDSLYPLNDAYRQSIAGRDFVYLLADDIIFYQRPLKSKTSLIADCPFELRHDKDGNVFNVKCAPKSHPLFQEFRIWQFIANLRILCRECEVNGHITTDVDVTTRYLGTEAQRVELFNFLYDHKSVKQKDLLGFFFKKNEIGHYRWNYVDDPDKEYPCNPTRADMLAALKKLEKLTGTCIRLLPAWQEQSEAGEGVIREMELWHILYSVSSAYELQAALGSFARKNHLPEEFATIAAKIKPYDRDYASYSLKALKKLLPLMRCGEMWSYEAIDESTKQRIEKLINGEVDETIAERVREKSMTFTSPHEFHGLPLWLACYVVYNRHSEAETEEKWKSPDDIRKFVEEFGQGKLRNPVVEQVVLETLRTVADIWQQCGTIDEIHVELGREMKNPADKRQRISQTITANENTNARIRYMMQDFMNPELQIEGISPDSPYQQELLKIYEDGAYALDSDVPKDILDIRSKYAQSEASKRPSSKEVMRYKLWLEQRYRSPYTGQTIPMARLFTRDYEIEHIIPQARYFDDSFSNKVICEAAVNKLKGKLLGYEFIKAHHGEIVDCGFNKNVEILDVDAYERLVAKMYATNKAKREKLMMDDIPDSFIARQLNDSRYMSRYILSLLSRIVRDDDEQESTSKHVIPVNGAITDRLKQDWGVNNKWNELILPRFLRMNKITGTTNYTYVNKEGKVVPTVPMSQMKGFNKKRIDHRHHAMDAIVIACATRNHVNLLNNESARSGNKEMRFALSNKLRRKEEKLIDGVKKMVFKEFFMPWESFPADVLNTLQSIIVSFKNKVRIIQKSSNRYTRFEKKDGIMKKVEASQDSSRNVTVRKSLHKDTVFGLVNIRRKKTVKIASAINFPGMIVDTELKSLVRALIEKHGSTDKVKKHFKDNASAYQQFDLNKVEIYEFSNDSNEQMVATRADLVSKFSDAAGKEAKILQRIEEITDTGIQKILLAHLEANRDNLEFAFSPEGLVQMNENITALNGGVQHKPIVKARFMETLGMKHPKGTSGCKAAQYVEAQKGTNLYYGVYADDQGKRSF